MACADPIEGKVLFRMSESGRCEDPAILDLFAVPVADAIFRREQGLPEHVIDNDASTDGGRDETA
jgi:hypothetical protein